jgi:hypothetical protein
VLPGVGGSAHVLKGKRVVCGTTIWPQGTTMSLLGGRQSAWATHAFAVICRAFHLLLDGALRLRSTLLALVHNLVQPMLRLSGRRDLTRICILQPGQITGSASCGMADGCPIQCDHRARICGWHSHFQGTARTYADRACYKRRLARSEGALTTARAGCGLTLEPVAPLGRREAA